MHSRLRKFIYRKASGKRDAVNTLYASKDLVIIDNFLPDEIFNQLKHWATTLECKYDRAERSFDQRLVLDFDECYGSRQWDIRDPALHAAPRAYTGALAKVGAINLKRLAHIGVQRWTAGSGVGPHNDGPFHTAITLYINTDWENKFFGDYIFYPDSRSNAIGSGISVSPRANRLVINKSNLIHKINRTRPDAPDRLTVQLAVPRNYQPGNIKHKKAP